MRCTLDLCANC